MIRLYPKDLFSDRFRIYRCLGQGGYGRVYHAYDLHKKREVALKISERPLTKEGDLLRTLATTHTQVPRCYAYGHDGQQKLFFLSMQLIAGQTLDDLLTTSVLRLHHMVDIVTQIATILATIHAHNIIVRDVKPSNIMLTPSGQVFLIDLGIAVHAKTPLSREERRTGTPAYLPSEVSGHGKISMSMDVYALGLVLRDLLSAQQHHRCARLSCTYCEQGRFLASLSQKMLAHVQQRPSSEEVLTLLQRTFATPPTRPVHHDAHGHGDRHFPYYSRESSSAHRSSRFHH